MSRRTDWELPAMPLRPKVGVVGLSSPLEVGAEQAPIAAAEVAQVLAEAGIEALDVGAFADADESALAGRRLAEAHVDAIVGVATSWYEDYLVLDLLEEWPVPLLLWSIPAMETGALCGSQQLTCFLRQLECPYRCVFGEVSDAACNERAVGYLRAAALHRRLRRARVGIAGSRVGGMTHTAPAEFMLKRAIGPRVVPLDLPGLLCRAQGISDETSRRLWHDVLQRAGASRVPEADGLNSMAMYAAVRELVEQHGLDALTIGCYPDLMGHVCLAASLLADEGVPLACEGDVNGAVGQLILQLLTRQPTHNTDWLNPLEDGTVIFTHCGSGSFSLAHHPERVTLSDVRLMGQGVCALYTAKPGPVTLLNLTTLPGGYQCALLEGVAVPTEMVFPGNPVRVRFEQKTSDLIDWVHDEGIGHHWMIGCDHVGATVRDWASCAGPGLRLVEP